MMHEPVFRARGLRKAFREQRVLDGFDLEVEPGAVTVLLGRNGAGKSTLLRLALGVLRLDAGELTVAGTDPWKQPETVRRRVGYVPDVPDACGWMKLHELFRFARPHYPTWNQEVAEALTEEFEIPAGTSLSDLSRGQGMKAMLVLALAPEPELLLLDEPFAGLDPVVREDVLRAVIGALQQGERTVLCATHELDVASRIADHVAVLEGGRIAVHGNLAEVLGDEEPAAAPGRLQQTMAALAAEGA